MSNRTNQIDNYFRVKVESASPMALIYMVYDRAIKTLRDSQEQIKKRKRNKFSELLIHAQDCIKELRSSLNLEVGEISYNLFRLYDFMINQLLEANITRENPLPYVNRVEHMLVELQATWKIAEKNLNIQQKQQKQQKQESNAEYHELSMVG